MTHVVRIAPLDLEEARRELCDECDGSGATRRGRCQTCEGLGTVPGADAVVETEDGDGA